MENKKGKIIAMPVTEPKEGMQVIYNNKIRIIISVIKKEILLNSSGGESTKPKLEELSELVIERIIQGYYLPQPKQIPIDFCDWGKVLDYNMIGKEVAFEFVENSQNHVRLLPPTSHALNKLTKLFLAHTCFIAGKNYLLRIGLQQGKVCDTNLSAYDNEPTEFLKPNRVSEEYRTQAACYTIFIPPSATATILHFQVSTAIIRCLINYAEMMKAEYEKYELTQQNLETLIT